ncbi:MAG: hypothetical protein CFH18_00471 [Alphaproteobacteria bacterium MarineAlpha5_Bin8]|nr:MAG: hypothetical protein CFH17_00649 [Alphaproteobacteria bacterium MarineAlpha5_Bin7]PPR47079.1 MAG: hypothetical protein CFH18_00471 [Alphaproteobacteria bacterium MarineAlpha5_Bin8]
MTDIILDFFKIFGINISSETLVIFVVPSILAIFLGFLLRISLSLCKQNWVGTYHNTMSFLMLPLIAFVITKVIAGNIPLALGMVGALSIVRFRHPVRNAFELVMYFALITIGISASVHLKFSIFLTFLLIIIIITSWILDKVFKMYNKNLYSFSFSEGQLQNSLEVVLNEKKDDLSQSKILLQEMHDEENKVYIYKFCSSDREQITSQSKYISEKYKTNIKNITTDYI